MRYLTRYPTPPAHRPRGNQLPGVNPGCGLVPAPGSLIAGAKAETPLPPPPATPPQSGLGSPRFHAAHLPLLPELGGLLWVVKTKHVGSSQEDHGT